MPEPTLIDRQRDALRELIRLAAERDRAEAEAERTLSARTAATERDYQERRDAIAAQCATAQAEAQQQVEGRRRSIAEQTQAGLAAAKAEFDKARRKIAADSQSAVEAADAQLASARWEATTLFEAGEKGARDRLKAARKRIDDAAQTHKALRDAFDALIAAYRKYGVKPVEVTPQEASPADDPLQELDDRIAGADARLAELEALRVPRTLKGSGVGGLFLLIAIVLAYPMVLAFGPLYGALADLAATLAIGFLLRAWLYAIAGMQVDRVYRPLGQELADIEALVAQARSWAEEVHKARIAEITARRDEEIGRAAQRHDKAIQDSDARRAELSRRAEETFAARREQVQALQEELRRAEEEYVRRMGEAQRRSEAEGRQNEEHYRTQVAAIRARDAEARATLTRHWREGMARVQATLEQVERALGRLNLPWGDPAWDAGPFPDAIPPVIRLGEVRVPLDQIPKGISANAQLMEGIPRTFTFPMLSPFPDRAGLLIEAAGEEGRRASIAALQAGMMRLLTSLPPGKVRFTLVDPIGLGRNFAAFMHLADFDEALVTTRVWTEHHQIEQRLADLSAHIEKVLQRYLRNEYASLQEYNQQAGEVAEPYRVLVIADFSVGFDESSARRLARIAAGGVRCGVLTMIAVDRDRPLPHGLDLAELRAHAVHIGWDGSRLVWKDPDFRPYPLAIDPPPPDEFATPMLLRLGAAARDANRVEVPFEFIAPPPDRLWAADSRHGIDIALGKAGATKTQNLRLGRGTAQHVLIAGRTGSGKSTLLHALITNLALNFSPDEVELYLIDFKKGVEFKTYANNELPHARVVAIESEREFGVSVLQRLDAELRERAEMFRKAGVQDLAGYRDAPGTPPLPRALLIVDEFQEFFVEDDKVAQEAALLLDRLVRQGRAFGVHVHLGSQTLGGAYALARSTLGQMAVRIALQCSEADAHLILSEDNSAARLLSRPGEAVYNDANGLVEGNHFFQVVWLGEERRERYLAQLRELARRRPPQRPFSQIVFEGNTASAPEKNPLLNERLTSSTWPETPRAAAAWLGEAVAIKDPTSAVFRRHGGSNLLVVGQNDEAALGIMASSLLSLAAQFAPAASDTVRSGAKFYVLDGTPEDHPQHGYLARVAELLPHAVTVADWRGAGAMMAELAEEVARRQPPEGGDGPELFLLIHDLQRFRDLRKREDDFGFSRRDEAASPADQFAEVLREGSGVGLHVLCWSDSLTTASRTFDRQGLREFEMRVLFQMSGTDSSHLIDSPIASRLGPYRAYFASEEQGRLEKFRPYGLPGEEWLGWVRAQFRRRMAPVEG
jgi:DNA segregation ATPase FtsK/SpoIIIE, S-DNA-T family